jgi:hypothetical protein
MDLAGMRWLGKFSGSFGLVKSAPCVRRSLFTEAEHQSRDRLLTMLSFRPVHCVNCFRRYYCFAKAQVR